MWRNSLRDLAWRRRRFAVAVAGAALVFASTLVLVGLTDSFHGEIHHSLRAFRADGWIVKSGGGGPFTSFRLIPEGTAAEVGRLPGVHRADPLIIVRQTARGPKGIVDANLVGYNPGGIGTPPVVAGRGAKRSGEVVVDEALKGVRVGGSVDISGRRFSVVGTTRGLTLFAGTPNVYMPIADAQDLLLFGQRLVNVVVVRGMPADLPEGLRAMSTAQVAADVARPLAKAVAALAFAQRILWIVAAFVIGAVVYTSALERARDFAVFKATGVSSGYVLAGLALQAIILSLIAAIVGIGVSRILIPLFPLHVTFPIRSVPVLFVEAIVVGLISSLFGARRAVSADPAVAFGGP
jgi:putative ABC transport system permease protein